MLLLTPSLAIEPLHDDDITIAAPSAILMEKQSGQIIYEKNAHEKMSPASVTKVMTMLLIVEAIDRGEIALSDMVTASTRASTFGGSCVYLKEGEKMSVEEMLKCIAVVSANDCAVAMAEHMCGTEQSFVDKMNARAVELGLENTNFKNCTGLFEDPEHYTTAYDIAVMSRELIKHEMIKAYTTIWMDTIRNGEFGLSSTNKLVYYYEGCTGLKTGYTNTAMYCISATAQREGVEYIAVIMHAESSDSRNNDAKTLLSYGFANYALCPLRASFPLAPVSVDLGKVNSVQPVYDGPEAMLMTKAGSAGVEYSVEIPETVCAPISAGDKLGVLTASLDGEVLAQVPIVAESSVPRQSIPEIFGNLFKILVGA